MGQPNVIRMFSTSGLRQEQSENHTELSWSRLFEIGVQQKKSPSGDSAPVKYLPAEGEPSSPLMKWMGARGATSSIATNCKSSAPTMDLTWLSRILAEDSACRVRIHVFSFWIMKSIVMCLAGIFLKAFPRTGNRTACHMPSELLATLIFPSEARCYGRKVMGAVPEDSSTHRINVLKHNLN